MVRYPLLKNPTWAHFMARTPKSSKRKKASREPYDKVLIVCEGSKTEPNYFEEIQTHYQISSLNIEIDGESGSSPSCVVKRAKELAKKEEKLGSPFDKVYCVFDKDNHASYNEALSQIRAQSGDVFQSAQSIPSFEFWLLLHFEYTTRAYVSQQGNSVGAQAVRDFKAKGSMAQYDKGEKGIFKKLFDQLGTAKRNAERVLATADANQTDNPSTHVHLLVDYLQNIKAYSE